MLALFVQILMILIVINAARTRRGNCNWQLEHTQKRMQMGWGCETGSRLRRLVRVERWPVWRTRVNPAILSWKYRRKGARA